jgi:hypothetical protein
MPCVIPQQQTQVSILPVPAHSNNYTAQQKKNFSLVPWFLGLFLGLFGVLI